MNDSMLHISDAVIPLHVYCTFVISIHDFRKSKLEKMFICHFIKCKFSK